MELYVSGVNVPKLGSVQDTMARQYLVKRANKDILLNKIMAHIAIASDQTGNKEWSNNITQMWNRYVNSACYLEDEVQLREEEMQHEFEYWKTVKPIVSRDDKGQLRVSGIVMPKARK